MTPTAHSTSSGQAYFLEIIDQDHIAQGDLEIIAAAGYDQPGQVKLGQARITDPPPDAPNARRLVSHNGSGLIGIIAEASFMMPPYNFSYWLLPLSPLPQGEEAGVRPKTQEAQ